MKFNYLVYLESKKQLTIPSIEKEFKLVAGSINSEVGLGVFNTRKPGVKRYVFEATEDAAERISNSGNSMFSSKHKNSPIKLVR